MAGPGGPYHCRMKPDPGASITRIVSWNIRAGGGRRATGILAQLLAWRPDIILLAEFRGTAASQWLATQLMAAGYAFQLTSIESSKPATNALLLASRSPLHLVSVARGPKKRSRWLLAEAATEPPITIGAMHAYNHDRPKLKYPMLNSILRMLGAWQAGAGLIIGDTNCGKTGIDEEKPSVPPFRREHDWMIAVERRRWTDAFRQLHGDRREFTWYSHRNNGFRLDHAFCSPELAPALTGASHRWGIDPAQPQRRDALSDHAALLLDFDRRKLDTSSNLKLGES